eukprot:snap_masked-scaffold_12-processed-gene-6.22-mRNA-1 protein AED:1.00 eAED:1.00 QI:0/-1/0/0/-1/1/1/0/481
MQRIISDYERDLEYGSRSYEEDILRIEKERIKNYKLLLSNAVNLKCSKQKLLHPSTRHSSQTSNKVLALLKQVHSNNSDLLTQLDAIDVKKPQPTMIPLSTEGSLSSNKPISPVINKAVDEKPVLPTVPDINSNFRHKPYKDSLNEILVLRKYFFSLESGASVFSKQPNFKIKLNHCLSNISLTSSTVISVLKKSHGTEKRPGPIRFLHWIKTEHVHEFENASYKISAHLVRVFCGNIVPETLKNGGFKFGLVYIALMLSKLFPEFYKVFSGCLYASSPYSYPGLFEDIVLNLSDDDVETSLKELGRKKGEEDGTYLDRLRAVAGFQAAFYQTELKTLSASEYIDSRFPFLPQTPDATIHPSNNPGIIFCWRFLAGHLNRPLDRFLPYVLQTFFAVCGYELQNQVGKPLLRKLLKVLSSEEFITKCKKTGLFDESEHNDSDRFKSFIEFFKEKYHDGKLKISPPGSKKNDARVLAVDVQKQ